MPSCNISCSRVLPTSYASTACEITPASGGISYLFFKTCAVDFSNIYDPAEWCRYVNQGKIVVTGELMGELPKASAVKTQYSSCRAESVNSRDWTLNAKDYNWVLDNGIYKVAEFWNALDTLHSSTELGFLTCDGRFYGWIPKYVMDVAPVIENQQTGTTFHDIVLMWKSRTLPAPLEIPGLISYVSGDCTGVPNYDPCETPTVTYDSLVLCDEQGVLLTASYYANATYQWFVGVTAVPGATQYQLVVQDPGSYTVTIIRPGCANVTTTAVVVTSSRPAFDNPEVTVSGTSPNATVTINPLGTVSDFLYSVTANGIQGPFLPSNVFTNLVSGSYTATIKNIATGCTESVTFLVP